MESIDQNLNAYMKTLIERLTLKDLELLKFLNGLPKASIDEISEAMRVHKNTASSILTALYKCCLINIEHRIGERNKIEYRINNNGRTVLKKIGK